MISACHLACALLGLTSALGSMGCARSTVAPPTASERMPASSPQMPPVVTTPALQNSPVREIAEPKPKVEEPVVTNHWKPTVTARDWKYIVLHHTATESGSVESIHDAHLQNKDKNGKAWLGIGYHFVIGNGNGMEDGAVEPTFRWRQQMHGAHAGADNPQYNQQGIGVCLVGNFEEQPPTAAQTQAIKSLVSELRREYGIPAKDVVGHNDIRQTECPGKLFPMAEIASESWPRPAISQSHDTHPLRVADRAGRFSR